MTPSAMEYSPADVASAALLLVTLSGLEPQALAWGLCGTVIGLPASQGYNNKLYSIALFFAATFACTLGGTWLSVQLFGGLPLVRNGCTLLFGIFFHPLLAAIRAKVPQMVSAGWTFIERRFFGVPPNGPGPDAP